MRTDTRSLHAQPCRTVSAGLPAALAGSLAILMTAAPAQAAEPLSSDLRTTSLLGTLGGGGVLAAATVAAVAGETHTVQPGDTVSAVAARHGLRTVDVLAINGLDWSSVIVPGQVLTLAAAAADAPSPPVALPAPPASAAGSYTVQGGDTISAIARLHSLPIPDLFAANGLDWSSIIYPGQTLVIPGAASASAPSEPAAPSERAAPAEPAAPEGAAPAPPAAPESSAESHIVAAGDTITAIAQQHGVTTQALLDANGLSRSSIIYPGQAVAIPAAASVILVSNTTPAETAPTTELDAEQVANAQIVISVGRELGVPDRGIAVALGTAMQESWLRNLDWGDRDSLGLFQQRPSAGWGTEGEVSDAAHAARAFYGGPSDPNGHTTQGLLDIAGWESLPFADAAQAVQISAYPDRYAQWEQPAFAWLALHG